MKLFLAALQRFCFVTDREKKLREGSSWKTVVEIEITEVVVVDWCGWSYVTDDLGWRDMKGMGGSVAEWLVCWT